MNVKHRFGLGALLLVIALGQVMPPGSGFGKACGFVAAWFGFFVFVLSKSNEDQL